MSILEGFSVFDFAEGAPSASVTRNGITFNKGVTLKLQKPDYVVLLFNASEKKMALKACSQDEQNAVKFYDPSKKKDVLSVRWNGRDLLNTVRQMTGWNLEKTGYKVEGLLYPEERVMLFDLNAATELS